MEYVKGRYVMRPGQFDLKIQFCWTFPLNTLQDIYSDNLYTDLHHGSYTSWLVRISCALVKWWFDLFKAFVYIQVAKNVQLPMRAFTRAHGTVIDHLIK